MRHAEKLHRDFAEAQHLAEWHDVECGFADQMVLFQTLLHERHGELRAKARRELKRGQQMLRGSDMVQVSVREEHGFDPIFATFEGRDVRDQIVDAEHVFIGELKSQVDDEDVAVALEDEAVATNLLESAKWIEPEVAAAALEDGFSPLRLRSSIACWPLAALLALWISRWRRNVATLSWHGCSFFWSKGWGWRSHRLFGCMISPATNVTLHPLFHRFHRIDWNENETDTTVLF